MSVAPLALMEWFRDDPLPVILPDPLVVAGGTRLLSEFLRIVASSTGGQLSIAAPYVCCAGQRDSPSMAALPHRHIDLRLVTRGPIEAARFLEEFGVFQWRSLVVRTHARLHAKMYTFVNSHSAGACLVGSHNFTRGGTLTNEEAGVLFRSSGDASVSQTIQACQNRIDELMREGKDFTDTLRWPSHGRAVTARR